MIETIIITALGSAGLFSLVQYLIQRHDSKKGKMASIESDLQLIKQSLEKNEKDQIRSQMLLMIADYPEENAEIMKLAKHYFDDLDGNWYMTSLFNNWLESRNLAKPEWFKNN